MSHSPIAIRLAEESDVVCLPEIERAAAGAFSETDLPPALLDDTLSEGEFLEAQRKGLLLVAVDGRSPIGFALAERFDDCLHLREMDVHPRYQRRGVGSGLLDGVVSLAREKGLAEVTLTTFRHVPWNAPWYAKQGWEIVHDQELTPWLRSILEREAAGGLDPERRVVMRRAL